MLAEIQQACADKLNAQSFFSAEPAIKVITEQLADYEAEIDKQVESLGICVLILTVTARDAQNNQRSADGTQPSMAFGNIDVRARVLCDPSLNNTNVSASQAAEAAAWFLRGLVPIANGASLMLDGIELAEDRAAPLAYDAKFSIASRNDTAPARRDPGPP